jgi:hypothetical protein
MKCILWLDSSVLETEMEAFRVLTLKLLFDTHYLEDYHIGDVEIICLDLI